MFVFVIPTYKRMDLLERCLQSLRRHEPDTERWKVVIVHDGGPTDVRDRISARFGADAQVRLFLRGQNEGFSRTANDGIAWLYFRLRATDYRLQEGRACSLIPVA